MELLGGEQLEAFEGDGRVKAVLTRSGRSIECDAVVIGAGVRPDAMLAQRAGLAVEDGIVCDSKLATSAEGVYAAGDCCSYDSVVHGRRIRVEHWDVAMQQGMHAARNMLGEDADYDVVPYFFSDLADWASLEYVGPAQDWDEEVWRGDRDAGEFSRLVPEGRPGRRRAQRRPPRRPRRSPPPARRPRRRLRRPRRRSPTPTATSRRSGEGTAEQGLEPRFHGPEPRELPLFDSARRLWPPDYLVATSRSGVVVSDPSANMRS